MHLPRRLYGNPAVKVIHVVPGIAEESSGPTYSVTRLCESLLEQGHEVTLATLEWGEQPNHPRYVKHFSIGIGPRRLGRAPTLDQWLRATTAAGGVDVLHNHGMWQMNAVYPARAARRGPARLVSSPRGAFSKWAMRHGSWSKALFWPLLQRPALRLSDCFHATSEEEYRDIRRLGFSQPIAVIPNGVDLPAVGATGVSNTGRTLLFLGRLHPGKGLDMLLAAWSQLEPRFPEWNLRIVGSDKGYANAGTGYGAKVQQDAADRRLARVIFTGELRGDEKWLAYRHAELFVLPTRSENFGIAVAESLATGTPAVVSRGAPWPELVAEGAGWWVETTADALTAALGDAMSLDAETLAQMGRRGREWMQRDFAWDGIARRMTDTYRWLAGDLEQRPDWVRID